MIVCRIVPLETLFPLKYNAWFACMYKTITYLTSGERGTAEKVFLPYCRMG